MIKIIKKHKIAAGFILLVILITGYFTIKALKGNVTETRYILAAVEKGTLISSISGSGQVSASNQADIKPKVSGEVTAVYVKLGQEVKSGTILAQLDTREATRTVRDAQTSLETAKLELDELLKPVDELTLLQAEDSLNQAENTKQKAEDNLAKSYEDGFNTVSNTFLNLPTIMSDLDDMFFTNSIETIYLNFDWYANQINRFDEYDVLPYKNDAQTKYDKAKQEYDINFDDYKNTTRDSGVERIETLIDETYNTTRSIAESIKSFKNYTDFIKSILIEKGIRVPAIVATHQASLDSSTSKDNSYLTSLLSARQSIKDYKQAITDAETSIREKTLSLAKTKAGADELTIRAKKIVIQQKQDALSTAQQSFGDHYVRAPFDGVVAKISIQKGDSVSSGTSIVTFVTKQRIAEISLNEVDVAKIKVGQKVNITFDAVEGLNITGEVAEVDAIGTVSQGVVTYNIKISFDTEDERVKPGMSVSAAIVTDAKQNVLLVPNSAVKTQGSVNYVQTLSGVKTLTTAATSSGVTSGVSPQQQIVEIGIANDSMTEIVSGLKEGDIVVIRTTTSKTQSTTTTSGSTQQNLFQMGGGGLR